jgi:hypothetical protein
MLFGVEGVRLLRENARHWETPQEHSEEGAPGPPTECELLERKSKGNILKVRSESLWKKIVLTHFNMRT